MSYCSVPLFIPGLVASSGASRQFHGLPCVWQSFPTLQVFMILSSFCDLVHVQRVIELFVKQLNNALNLHKITKIRVKSQKYGRNTGDFAKMPVYMGMPV